VSVERKELVMEETRDAYRQKCEAELKELDARLDLLESRAEKAEAEAKIGYSEQIYELREKRDNLKKSIAGLKEATGEAWTEMKQHVEEAVADLKTALDVAATRFE
jgi:small-conductance mechanosensitive channel